jgi:putative cell wall-binding protein
LKSKALYKTILPFLCILLISLSINTGAPTYAANTTTTINYSTSKSEIYTGDSFDIVVNIANVTDLYGASIDFKYNPALIKVLNIQKGKIFDNTSVNSGIVQRDDANGNISFYTTRIGSTAGINSTNSTLFVVKVQAVKNGAFTLKTTKENITLSPNAYNLRIKLANSKPASNSIAYTASDLSINIGGASYQTYTGADRYLTSIKVSQAGWAQSDYAILANGENFPDALSAAPLAGKYNAPILLTPQKTLNADVSKELDRLKVKTVFIIGGWGAVSTATETNLKNRGLTVTRISGADRFETSLNIAKQFSKPTQVIVVNGRNFPDALSVAAYAAANKIPILLTDKNALTPAISNYIKSNPSITKTYIIGGTGVVYPSIEKTLPNPTRLAGADRYETNLAVIKGLNFDFSNTYVALGTNFPDALSASALAGKTKSPTLIINGKLPAKVISDIQNMKSKIGIKHLIGAAGTYKEYMEQVVLK